MTRRTGLSSWTSTLAVTLAGVGAAAAICGGAMVSTSSEALLRSSFSAALGDTAPAQQRFAKATPVAGSEDYWLSAMRQEGGTPLTKTVSVGDHISLSLGGHDRQLDVSAVSEFAPTITEIDTSAGPNRFVLVTARDAGRADARPIRFVMEIEQTTAPLSGTKTARAL